MGKYYKHKRTKSGYLICVVPMCQTKKSTTTLKTFEFPSDRKRRSQWISSIVEATMKNEKDTLLEDLYTLENRRMELEMEITNILGDHSYVCARHFQPEDIIVHPNVCRLTANAVPSIFNDYPTELPRQFFKKICQTARSIGADSGTLNADNMLEQTDSDDGFDNCVLQEVTIYEPYEEDPMRPEVIDVHESCSSHPSESLGNDCGQSGRSYFVVSRGTNTKLKYTGVSNAGLRRNKVKKKLRLLQLRYKNLKDKLIEIETKHRLYNISSLEKDAENNNEEALFLLEMLRSYTIFEKTRKEILTSQKRS